MKRSTISLAASATIATLAITGCTDSNTKKAEPTWEEAARSPFVPVNYKAAESLIAQMRVPPGQAHPLIIATVVNIDAIEQSSTLGRLISEHVSARFTQVGYRAIEMKFRNSVYVKRDQGELMLTREIKELAQSYEAQAVVVGTYGAANDYAFVNLKVVDPKSNIVLAAHDYVIPLDTTTKALLRSRAY